LNFQVVDHGHQMRANLRVGVVLLAAGAGSRMGYRPKPTLILEGQPIINRLIQACINVHATQVVLVLGHHAQDIMPLLGQFPPALVLCNTVPEAGQVSSLRLGLAALGDGFEAVMVCLADQPCINATDLDQLLDAYELRPSGTHVTQPYKNGTPGNPVIFSNDVRLQILSQNDSFGCRQWQALHPDQVHRWETSNQHYFFDVDTPADLLRFSEMTGKHLGWSGTASNNLSITPENPHEQH
jgi:molybdenum cofactor cytidylyltransferase